MLVALSLVILDIFSIYTEITLSGLAQDFSVFMANSRLPQIVLGLTYEKSYTIDLVLCSVQVSGDLINNLEAC